MDNGLLHADAAALIRAYVRGDAAAFDQLVPGKQSELLLVAFGVAVQLAQDAAGGPERLDDALQWVIDWHRQPGD